MLVSSRAKIILYAALRNPPLRNTVLISRNVAEEKYGDNAGFALCDGIGSGENKMQANQIDEVKLSHGLRSKTPYTDATGWLM